jgi:hypothetical protein
MITYDKYNGVNCIRTYPNNYSEYTASTVRFTDKEKNVAERSLYSNYWREQIDLYGQKILYYKNLYNLEQADNTYGEMPLNQFETPKEMIMLFTLTENSLILSKFGYQSDDQVTAYLHISSFYAHYPPNYEPKAGDVFKLVEYGSDRPNERDGKMYEITERCDEDNSKINPLAGHYIWLLKAKRLEHSFENLPQEKGNAQVHDDTFYGDLTGALVAPPQRDPSYPQDSDTESKEKVFDMSINDTLEYGGYY